MFEFPSLLDVQDPAPDLLVAADLEQSTSASWHWTGNRNPSESSHVFGSPCSSVEFRWHETSAAQKMKKVSEHCALLCACAKSSEWWIQRHNGLLHFISPAKFHCSIILFCTSKLKHAREVSKSGAWIGTSIKVNMVFCAPKRGVPKNHVSLGTMGATAWTTRIHWQAAHIQGVQICPARFGVIHVNAEICRVIPMKHKAHSLCSGKYDTLGLNHHSMIFHAPEAPEVEVSDGFGVVNRFISDRASNVQPAAMAKLTKSVEDCSSCWSIGHLMPPGDH